MATYGYHRTSTTEQHLDRGIYEITSYCKDSNIDLIRIYTDKLTGKNFNRPRYTIMKEDVLRSGDTLIITEIDRLGRNKQDILHQLQYFRNHNIRIMVLELPTTLVDIREMDNEMARLMLETINNMMLELYASIAQAEMHKKEKRQREGIESKKARGEWADYGRPRAMDFDLFCKEYQRVVDGKTKPFDLMRELKLTKPTFYRYKKKFDIKNLAIKI